MELYEKATKKHLIMELYRKGMTRKEISRVLKTYYNYVCSVIREMEPKVNSNLDSN